MTINGANFTVTADTLCNNGSVQKYFTGGAPSGWSLGALGVRAFPGAEGMAALTRGAAGYSGTKSIAVVSNLNDSGAGSFRDAVEGAGKEGTFVVFTVGGTIELSSDIRITSSYITILTQTCPADSGGICLAGYKLIIGQRNAAATTDLIIRHLRARRGNYTVVADDEEDTLVIWAKSQNIMLDHCSFSWGGDETCSLTTWESTTPEDAITNVTFSHCIISHGLTDVATSEANHGYGLLLSTRIAGAPSSCDIHNSLFAHHNSRMPEWGAGINLNVINNIMYNPWHGQGSVFYAIPDRTDGLCNYIGNYVKAGPDTYDSAGYGMVKFFGGGTQSGVNGVSGLTPYPALYMNNNYGMNRLLDGDAEWQTSNGYGTTAIDAGWESSSEFTASAFTEGVPVTRKTITASTLASFESTVLADAGATVPARDSYDASVVSDVVNGTGGMYSGTETQVTDPANFPALAAGTPRTDTNGDGLPDEYEISIGEPVGSVDPLADSGNGYLHIEMWAATLAGDV